MLKLRVDKLLAEKGAEHPQVYLMKFGFSAREARTLVHGIKVEQMRDRVLQRLCEALLCVPNDVFRWFGAADNHLVHLNKWPTIQVTRQLKGAKSAEDADRLLARALAAIAQEDPVQRMTGGRLFLNVGRLLLQRQVKHPNRELVRMGFTWMEAQRLLSSERKAFKMKVLTRLCIAFGCLPNELFDFEGPEGHVLNAVRKAEACVLDERLSGLTDEQLRRVAHAMQARAEASIDNALPLVPNTIL